jgi:hypothetical protein
MRPQLALAPVVAALSAAAAIALPFGTGLAHAAGAPAGNGGDTIACTSPSVGLPAGTYALDFVLTGTNAADLEAADSLEASLQHVEEQLYERRDLLPNLSDDFHLFTTDLFNTQDATRANYWVPVEGELDRTDDQRIDAARIPAGCRASDGAPRTVQALVRFGSDINTDGTETTTYHYAPAELAALRAQDPVQASMLLVHAWLSRISPDVVMNRKINRFLHSRRIASLSDQEVRRQLEAFGFDFARVGLGADETEVSSGTYATRNGIGMSLDSACMEPRREYADFKLHAFAVSCAELAGQGHARVVTRSYRETVGATGGQLYCFVEWSYACAASPQDAEPARPM